MVFCVLTSQILVCIDRDAHQIAAPPRAQLGAPCASSHHTDVTGGARAASPLLYKHHLFPVSASSLPSAALGVPCGDAALLHPNLTPSHLL